MVAQGVEIGFRPPHALFAAGAGRLRGVIEEAESAGVDRLFVGDHVTFHGGRGFDGLVQATALAVLASKIKVQTSVYLLPLRHPVAVARQVASLAELAPGRFVFGVGLGGDDRAEVEACGVDPRTRGRRMNESLMILRELLAGATVSIEGEFFSLTDVQVLPAPSPAVPVIIGGRTDAALRRVGRLGDGWLGLWVSPQRWSESQAAIEEHAADAGRTGIDWQHALTVWCGFGDTPDGARAPLAREMESLYKQPFEKFEKYCPYGTPEDVAAFLIPFVQAGCSVINIIPAAADGVDVIDQVATTRAIVRANLSNASRRAS
jgi:alkanesulfonate monooxygenase SsuD/methylene tetrahydromethanopterin reductase-like flavin-dependent oxidoreductase (luciferase family)